MKNFALFGVGGYVAPRHLKAIKETGNQLIAAYDKNDSVGILDQFFPYTKFFTEYELFDRHCTKLKNTEQKIDYLSICTPNYLHDSHIRYGMRLGADIICEKPLVLNPWNIDGLKAIEENTGHKINTILQLRLHPAIKALKKQIENGPKDKIYDIDLTYITSRGNWYYASWKGNEQKSGGVATNIGIHFYDMLTYIFGEVKQNVVHVKSHDRVAGFLELAKAKIRYFLSINSDHLPKEIREKEQMTYRSITIEGREIEFSNGFTDLHTESYKQILEGNGFGIEDSRSCISIVHDIRNAQAVGLIGDFHPMAKYPLCVHPFESQRMTHIE
ncbi:MAG: Gfo/Idh/MocA family oxidoreductase [Bacteroidales bacterium]|nr:Gfo/Idh/MocA family oxidoreductase [Bacteroidales bacterium]